ncbi:MAG: hypothetical protein Hyperionvirus5_82 [Hyperionvirus sp.]|uniref:Uncharacterized protein n=1 Tax=Hyperionvirus sp. TaxID=2487770 RepID=A0A3G5A7P2_9VIRU|nr:MAG: hypothetical protein Hyperionvirus5_82 [Hyperionvirus sp.]
MLVDSTGMSFSEAKQVELAEKWKQFFSWDEKSERLITHPDGDLYNINRTVADEKERDECVAYKRFLEEKAGAAYDKHWNAFKVRPEVKTFADLSPEEVVQLEEKWSGLIWYNFENNDICSDGLKNNWTPKDWDTNNPYQFRPEMMLLYAFLGARIKRVSATLKELNKRKKIQMIGGTTIILMIGMFMIGKTIKKIRA